MEHQRHGRHSRRTNRHLHSVDSNPTVRTSPIAPADPPALPTERAESHFRELIPYVGDVDALTRLDTTPLPEERFDWSVVEPQDQSFVERVLALSEEYCRQNLDGEYVTITRRILARVAVRDPGVFRRRADPARCAASLVWLAGRANGYFGRRLRRSAEQLWLWFNVTDCSARGRSLRRSAGLEVGNASGTHYFFPQMPLGDATLLHSEFRGAIVRWRNVRADAAVEQRRWTLLDDGRTMSIRAEPTGVVTVAKGTVAETGEVSVFVALGESYDDARFFALSVADAVWLGVKLAAALGEPDP